jgi:hypothetical protein
VYDNTNVVVVVLFCLSCFRAPPEAFLAQMRSTSLRKLVCGRVRRSYGSSRPVATDLLHRDMFVFDESWSHSRWAKALTKAIDLNIKDHGNILTNALKHPSSGHVIAQYSLYHFNHSSFHFTSQGEYSLNVTAAQSINCDLVAHTTTHQFETDVESVMEKEGQTKHRYHSVLLWPDNILIRHLRETQLGSVLDKCFRAAKLDINDFKDSLNTFHEHEGSDHQQVTVTQIEKPVVLVSVQAGEYAQASETLAAFKRVSDSIIQSSDNKDSKRAPSYVMSKCVPPASLCC